MFNYFLTFSDAAKFADIAKNLIVGSGFVSEFSFIGGAPEALPITSILISMFMYIFGVNDFSVIATSFFFFILTLLFVYLLSHRISKSIFVGVLSTLAVGFNYDLINYATNGASESPFIFEIVATSYLLTLKKRWSNVASVLLMLLMYFTRPQAFIYIAGLIFYYLLLNFEFKKALKYFGLVLISGVLFDTFVLSKLSGNFFVYSILNRGSNVLSQVGVSESASNQLRSGALTYSFSYFDAFKKLFYNLYNFYKLLPQIINPYVFVLFVIGLFKKTHKEIKISFLFMVVVTFFVTALSIPFFRYIHPVIPLIYILGIVTLSEVIANKKVLLFLVGVLCIGQTLGILLLDSRFERKNYNVGRPPVYVLLSEKLKEDTPKDAIILTNLDTWGSWYGERKTVWFPNDPGMIEGKNFDAIYLTSYKMDDENYYMGESWREMFNNPQNQDILNNYKFIKEYKIDASENYERLDARGVLFIKK